MTTIKETFQIAATTQIGYVALKVANLNKMTDFYKETIGLTVLEQTATESLLGVDGNVLVHLKKISDALPLTPKTGLFHVAFLLPTRKDLGNALVHYLQVKAPLTGASDHGYSEALYLTDPEGNGIEVYHDKPKSQWDIRADGQIIGVTEPMDVEGVLAESDHHFTGYPTGTSVGHVHLKVADLIATDNFYTQVLGLTLTSNFGTQAKFFAAGEYHHHLGANTWLGAKVASMEERDLGLDYYTYQVPNRAELNRLEDHFKTLGIDYQADAGELKLKDPNGIMVVVTLNPQIN